MCNSLPSVISAKEALHPAVQGMKRGDHMWQVAFSSDYRVKRHCAAQGVKRGDRVWQIAFGSGFKCNSAVWRARRAITTQHEAWLDRPHPGYPATPEVYA